MAEVTVKVDAPERHGADRKFTISMNTHDAYNLLLVAEWMADCDLIDSRTRNSCRRLADRLRPEM